MTLYFDIYSVPLLSFSSHFLLLPSSPSLLTPLTCNQPGRSSPHSLLYRAIASPRGSWRHTSRCSTIHTSLTHPHLTLPLHTLIISPTLLSFSPHTLSSHPHLTLPSTSSPHTPSLIPHTSSLISPSPYTPSLISPSPHTPSSHPPLTITHRYIKRWTRYNWTRRRALWLHPPQSLQSHQK